jgi:hypothetical protein
MTGIVEGSAIWDISARCSPHAAAADVVTYAWVDSHELCEDPAERRNLARIRPGLLAAYCHPDATEADVTLIAQWMAWLFLLDDRIDESDLGRAADPLEEQLRNLQGVTMGTRAAEWPLSRALEAIIARASVGMTDAWQLRFRQHVSEYLSGCVWQAAHRQSGQVPNPDAFAQWRRAFGAIMPSFDLIERTDGGALPSSVYYSRPYQDLLIAAADVVCWTNDLMTVDKEAEQGDLHNLVLVTAHHHNQDRQAATATVSAACEQRIATYLAGCQDLSGLTATLDLSDVVRSHVDRCSAALGVWIRGHLEWGYETPRYQSALVGEGR